MSFNGPIWSVSAEVFVYVGFFLLLRSFGRSPWLIVGAIAAGLASMWSGATSPALICAGYFFAGGAAAEWMRKRAAREPAGRARGIAVAIDRSAGRGGAVPRPWRTRIATGLPTWLMAVVPAVAVPRGAGLALARRWQRLIQAAGNLTYSTYLIHFPMQLVIAIIALASGIALPVGEAWFLLAYLGVTIVLGRIVFVRFEAPMQTLIRAATLNPHGRPPRPDCLADLAVAMLIFAPRTARAQRVAAFGHGHRRSVGHGRRHRRDRRHSRRTASADRHPHRRCHRRPTAGRYGG